MADRSTVMTTYTRAVCAAALAGGVLVAGGPLWGQGADRIGTAPITHIGVVVEDVEAATDHFADVMGMTLPDVETVNLELPDDTTVEVRRATARLPNLAIAFDQPITASGPIHDHLQEIGQSIHRIAFGVADGIDAKRAFLEAQGGTWTAGVEGGGYAYVDLKDSLGATIEVVRHAGPIDGPAAVPPEQPAPLGQRAVSHVGLAVTDTDEVAAAFSDALGVPVPTVFDYKDAQYPPGHDWSMEAYLRIGSWRHDNVGMELLGSVGEPNPWSDYVDRFGGSVIQHIAIPVGPQIGELTAELQEKGGEWTNGREGGAYAYLDFVDSFGLAFELNGTPAE